MEILLSALAEAILSILIEDLAQQPKLAALRDKLRGNSPEKLALQRSLAAAFATFSVQYPGLAASFFDEHFLNKPEVAGQLAKLLTPNRSPDQAVLEQLWSAQFGRKPTVDLLPPLTSFIATLAQEIKAQPALKSFVDSQAFDQLYDIAERNLDQVKLQTQIHQELVEIRKLIAQGQQVQQGDRQGAKPHFPLQRPRRAEYFTGREQELAALLAQLQPGRGVTIWGPGGIGKTALAAEAIWQLMPGEEPPARFPDGVLFYSFYGRPDPALAFEHLVRSYDDTAQDLSAEAAYRLLAGKRALVVLDGAEDATDLPSVLEVTGGCGVLVTSRKRRDADGTERQELAPLDLDEALKLLRAWAEAQIDNEAAAQQICELVGGMPLAVRLAGRYLDETGELASEYLDWLEKTPLQALDHGRRRLESVPVLLAYSLAQVSEEARQVLAVTGLLALASFDREVIAASLPEIDVRQALGQLVNYGLLLRDKERYAVSHALIHTYARRRLMSSEAMTERLAEYYTALSEEQTQRGVAGYRRLDEERLHLMRVLAGCEENEAWEAASNLY